MKSGIRVGLWIVVAVFALLAAYMLSGLESRGSDAYGRGMSYAFGGMLGIVALGGAAALVLSRYSRAWIWLGAVILAVPFLFITVMSVKRRFESAGNERETREMHSGAADFGGQPALLKVAEAVSGNAPEAIRAAAKNLPDLNAAGREGKTLLYFAVDEALVRPELCTAVETLLSAGANPNYTNGEPASFALARAVSGEVRLLRTMLDAGGNPNALDPEGKPIIFGNWKLLYFEADQRARMDLLLDRGADVNATIPESIGYAAGQTLLLFRTGMGLGDSSAYADAIDLLERGADPARRAKDGMTLASLLEAHRKSFTSDVPREFIALEEWLKRHP